MKISDQAREKLVQALLQEIGLTTVDLTNYANYALLVFQRVQAFKMLTVPERKDLISYVLMEIVRRQDAGALDVLDPIIIALIPPIVDTFYDLNPKRFCACF